MQPHIPFAASLPSFSRASPMLLVHHATTTSALIEAVTEYSRIPNNQGGVEIFQKVISGGGDDYSVLEVTL